MKVAPDNRYDYGTVVIHTEMNENGTMILELANGQKITIDLKPIFPIGEPSRNCRRYTENAIQQAISDFAKELADEVDKSIIDPVLRKTDEETENISKISWD